MAAKKTKPKPQTPPPDLAEIDPDVAAGLAEIEQDSVLQEDLIPGVKPWAADVKMQELQADPALAALPPPGAPIEEQPLPCKLSDAQVIERSQDLAAQIKDLRELREAKALTVREINVQIKAATKTVQDLAQVVATRSEVRGVKVWLRFLWDKNLVEIVRVDTGEVVGSRTPTEDEKQKLGV